MPSLSLLCFLQSFENVYHVCKDDFKMNLSQENVLWQIKKKINCSYEDIKIDFPDATLRILDLLKFPSDMIMLGYS